MTAPGERLLAGLMLAPLAAAPLLAAGGMPTIVVAFLLAAVLPVALPLAVALTRGEGGMILLGIGTLLAAVLAVGGPMIAPSLLPGMQAPPGSLLAELAVAAGGLTSLAGLAVGGARRSWLLLAGLLAAAVVGLAVRDPDHALIGIALGAVMVAAPAIAMAMPDGRGAMPTPASLPAGLVLAAAVAAPLVPPVLAGLPPIAGPLALATALPGLLLLLAPWRATAAYRALTLLAIQALLVALLLPASAVPAQLLLMSAETVEGFRWALLGAAFLPSLLVLVAASRGAWLALAAFGLGAPALALLIGPPGLLAAPLLATLIAFLLPEETAHAAGA